MEEIDEFNVDDFEEFSFDINETRKEIVSTGPSSKARKNASDKYKDNAKIFLETMDIFDLKNIKKSTYKYIYHRDGIPIPEKGEQIRIRTQCQLNLISVILAIVSRHSQIEELTIATYTLNRESMSILMQLKNAGKIKKISLLIASSYGYRDPKWKAEIEAICIKSGISLTFAWLHFKITIAKCGNNYYQFEGSMNYSTNNMAEQIIFENNEWLYDHDFNLINTVMKDSENKALEFIC